MYIYMYTRIYIISLSLLYIITHVITCVDKGMHTYMYVPNLLRSFRNFFFFTGKIKT